MQDAHDGQPTRDHLPELVTSYMQMSPLSALVRLGDKSYSQGRLLPYVRPFVVFSHRGPVRALHVQLSMGTAHTAAGQALVRRETQ